MKHFLLLAWAVTIAATAAPVTITLPPETAAYQPAPGVELVQANCYTCHSAHYVQTQPPMARKFWEGTVKKMREKYAAPIAEESVSGLVDYLTANYGIPNP